MKRFLATICAVAFLISGCGDNKQTAQPAQSSKVEQSAQTPAPPKILNLGMTLEQFQKSYRTNALMIAGNDFNIDNAELKVGSVQDVFQCNLSQDLVVMGNIDKASGLVKEAWVLCSPKSSDTMLDGLIVYGLIISVVSPELTTEQRRELMLELKIMDERIKELSNGARVNTIRGNVKYATGIVTTGVFMFSASAKDL